MEKKLIIEEIKNIKYLLKYKPGRVISEQDLDLNDDQFRSGSNYLSIEVKSLLKKHGLLDKVEYYDAEFIHFNRQPSEVTQKFLEIAPLIPELNIIAFVDCEYVDFSNVNICGLPNLVIINVNGTENNLNDQGFECLEEMYNLPGSYVIRDF
jgi:hypothetical protein